MEEFTNDRVTISGPAEDIDTIIDSFSTEQVSKDGTHHMLLLDGAKLMPYPPELNDSSEDDLGSPRANWRRDKWGCAWPSFGGGVTRVAPTRVIGNVSTRWVGPLSLYLELSRRVPRCVIVAEWTKDSGIYENGWCGEEMMVNGAIVHKHDNEPPPLEQNEANSLELNPTGTAH